MNQYLIEGEIPDAVRIHFVDWMISTNTATVSVPRSVSGYLVPEAELHCSEFQAVARLSETYISSHTHETEVDEIFFVGEADDENRVYTVNYPGESQRTLRLLEQLAKEFKTDIVCMPPTERCFRSGSDYCRLHEDEYGEPSSGTLYIHFNCAGRNRGRRANLERLYEFSLEGTRGLASLVRTEPLKPAGGIIIYDTNGEAVAEVEDRVVYILVNLEASRDGGFLRGTEYWSHNAQILERILREAIPMIIGGIDSTRVEELVTRRRELVAPRKEDAIERFLRDTDSSRSQRILRLERQVAEQSRTVRGNLQRYLQSASALRDIESELRAVRRTPNEEKENLRRQLENILTMPHVIGISYGETLEVYTDTIWIEWQGVRRKIGAFIMIIDFEDGVIIRNYANASPISGPHPHIDGEGYPCFGNISEAVAKLEAEREIEALVTVLIQFLESYEPGSPHEIVEHWPAEEVEGAHVS